MVDEKLIEEEEKKKNPERWKKNNEWLEKITELLKKTTPEMIAKERERLERFLDGELTWAELQGLSPDLLYKLTEYAYLQFQRGRLKDAETIFQGLAAFDHTNAYYHTLLGAIYQCLNQWGEALAEYTVAIEMDPKDITSYVNRGEIYYRCGYVEEPISDFEKAIALDPEGKDPWANRGRFLKKLVLKEEEEEKQR